MMKITTKQLALQLENPFKLSYGTTSVRENVLITLTSGNLQGVGEAAVVPYYDETPQRVIADVTRPAVEQALGNDPLLLQDILTCLPPGASMSARAALDMALHDLWGQAMSQPLYRLWGLNPDRSPVTSFTI